MMKFLNFTSFPDLCSVFFNVFLTRCQKTRKSLGMRQLDLAQEVDQGPVTIRQAIIPTI